MANCCVLVVDRSFVIKHQTPLLRQYLAEVFFPGPTIFQALPFLVGLEAVIDEVFTTRQPFELANVALSDELNAPYFDVCFQLSPETPTHLLCIITDVTAHAVLGRQLRQERNELQLNINYRERIEAELRTAKEQAEQANQAKSRFLATMSHEFRTPLNPPLSLSDSPTPNLTEKLWATALRSSRNCAVCSRIVCRPSS